MCRWVKLRQLDRFCCLEGVWLFIRKASSSLQASSELKRPFGWEAKRLEDSETGPVASTSPIYTEMTRRLRTFTDTYNDMLFGFREFDKPYKLF